MPRYIDAEALDNRIKSEWAKEEDDKGYGLAHFFVETQPTADVALVVHGHWIKGQDGDKIFCSACNFYLAGNFEYVKKTFKFCFTCGAHMDEEIEEDAEIC